MKFGSNKLHDGAGLRKLDQLNGLLTGYNREVRGIRVSCYRTLCTKYPATELCALSILLQNFVH